MCALLKGPEKPYNKTYFKTYYIMYCFFFSSSLNISQSRNTFKFVIL